MDHNERQALWRTDHAYRPSPMLHRLADLLGFDASKANRIAASMSQWAVANGQTGTAIEWLDLKFVEHLVTEATKSRPISHGELIDKQAREAERERLKREKDAWERADQRRRNGEFKVPPWLKPRIEALKNSQPTGETNG